MTNTQEMILEYFKKFKVPVDGILMQRSIDTRSWDRRSQDEFADAVNGLIADEYISMRNNDFVLIQKGYDYIFQGYSLQDTKDLIMDIFRKHKIGVGEILMPQSFLPVQQAERFHFDNFTNAMQSLIDDSFFEITNERYYRLLQPGYDYIY